MSRSLGRWGVGLWAAVLVAGCGGSGGSSPSPSPTTTVPAGPAGPPFTVKGMTHVEWSSGGYLTAQADDSRQAITPTLSNWVGVLVTWYMDRRDSNTIAPGAQTPSSESVVHAIQQLHSLGLKVMLKPHVDVNDGAWRGTIRPTDTGLWFSSYDAFLAHEAQLAQANGVELLDVGTELVTMSDFHFSGQWTSVISHVRGSFHGPLTYGANANSPGDEFTSVSFWSQLDYAGLDVYAPLTNHADPTVAELTSAWSGNMNGDNMLAAYRNWQSGHGKPVLFTEIGYRSLAGGNRAPYDFSLTGAPDPTEQANCYEAAFTVWSKETWLRGVFWWAWPTTPAPGPSDTDYTPRGKPAESVLKRWNGS